MDTLGIEPRASRMLSGCDTTTPCALDGEPRAWPPDFGGARGALADGRAGRRRRGTPAGVAIMGRVGGRGSEVAPGAPGCQQRTSGPA